MSRDSDRVFEVLDLTEYETEALQGLLKLGRTSAPDLADATGIPKARVYEVLDELADAGYIKIIPERPKQYQPKPPEDILDRAIENRRQDFTQFHSNIESLRSRFINEFGPLYEAATDEVTPTEELFYVVDVGEASERETHTLYTEATREINVVTKSFEYFDNIQPAIQDALDRGISMRVLMLQSELLSTENQAIQARIRDTIADGYPAVDLRYSQTRLPLRGTIVDPSLEYESGRAIFLVEEEDIPLHMRQAAVTENPSLVAAINRYFSLIWDYDSTPTP